MSHHENHPISNLEYDWITIIQNKAEAVRAYDQYIQDAQNANSQACVELMQRIRDEDMQHLEEARQHLMMVMNGEMGNAMEMGGSGNMGGQQGMSSDRMSSMGGSGSMGGSSMGGSGSMGGSSMSSGTMGDGINNDDDTTANSL
ncbi:MAG: hypothetical protein MUD01_14030 [Chloroflexaceae bacterium]|jgi:hypothetical protein|nr:hypothetical protein [Chloroflexaceae bacterium]